MEEEDRLKALEDGPRPHKVIVLVHGATSLRRFFNADTHQVEDVNGLLHNRRGVVLCVLLLACCLIATPDNSGCYGGRDGSMEATGCNVDDSLETRGGEGLEDGQRKKTTDERGGRQHLLELGNNVSGLTVAGWPREVHEGGVRRVDVGACKEGNLEAFESRQVRTDVEEHVVAVQFPLQHPQTPARHDVLHLMAAEGRGHVALGGLL